MNKKFLLIAGIAFTLVLTSTLGIAFANGALVQKKEKPSDYKIGMTYEQALEKQDKPVLALFYVDWCGYCLRFMPKLKVMESLYGKKYNFVMLNAEDPANETLVRDASLQGYPTLYILDPKYDNQILLNNAIYYDLPKMKTELNRYLRIRKLLDKASALEVIEKKD